MQRSDRPVDGVATNAGRVLRVDGLSEVPHHRARVAELPLHRRRGPTNLLANVEKPSLTDFTINGRPVAGA